MPFHVFQYWRRPILGKQITRERLTGAVDLNVIPGLTGFFQSRQPIASATRAIGEGDVFVESVAIF